MVAFLVPALAPRQAGGAAGTDNLPHNDEGPLLNAVFWAMTALALVFMSLRLACKYYYHGRYLWWDDYVLVASWVALCVSAATTTVCVALDYGKHSYDMRPENMPKMPFVAVFAGFFSVLAASWSKTSFALTLLRLSSDRRWMRLSLWFIIISLNAILGTAMLFMWIKCTPFAKIWDDRIQGYCIPPAKVIVLYQWSAGYSGAIDFTLALCPWILLWKMRLNKREKFGIATAMSMGVIAGAASITKLVKLPQLAGDPVDTVAVTLWGSTEGALTIIAASIPVLRTLVQSRKFTSAVLSPSDQDRLQQQTGSDATVTGPSLASPSSGKMHLGSPSLQVWVEKGSGP